MLEWQAADFIISLWQNFGAPSSRVQFVGQAPQPSLNSQSPASGVTAWTFCRREMETWPFGVFLQIAVSFTSRLRPMGLAYSIHVPLRWRKHFRASSALPCLPRPGALAGDSRGFGMVARNPSHAVSSDHRDFLTSVLPRILIGRYAAEYKE